jgi:hypothetical protein
MSRGYSRRREMGLKVTSTDLEASNWVNSKSCYSRKQLRPVPQALSNLKLVYTGLVQRLVTGASYGANMCISLPLEVKGKGIRGVEGVVDKEKYTVRTKNIISQRQYFVARCLSSCVGT